jgi:uncharacterized protein (TIGR00369 family)
VAAESSVGTLASTEAIPDHAAQACPMTEHDAIHGALPERLRFSVLEVTVEQAHARLQVEPGLFQGAGILHGGVLFTLADSVAASYAMKLHPRGGATIDAAIRFFRPVSEGHVDAFATLLHQGRRTLAVQVELFDAKRRGVAHYTTTFMIQP